jgi:hypothetical protein
MTENCCPECGHLLSKRRLECLYCGWSRYDPRSRESLFDPEDAQGHHGIYSTDYDEIDRLIDTLNHDTFEG